MLLSATSRYHQLCKGQSLLLFILWLMFLSVGHVRVELCPGSGLGLGCVLALKSCLSWWTA